MKYVVLFIICATILFTLIPQSYAELYYNEKYSFSVDIPSGWTVTGIDPLSDEGILICDGNTCYEEPTVEESKDEINHSSSC